MTLMNTLTFPPFLPPLLPLSLHCSLFHSITPSFLPLLPLSLHYSLFSSITPSFPPLFPLFFHYSLFPSLHYSTALVLSDSHSSSPILQHVHSRSAECVSTDRTGHVHGPEWAGQGETASGAQFHCDRDQTVQQRLREGRGRDR